MKPWYKKKKVWCTVLTVLVVLLTMFLAPEKVDKIEKIGAAIITALVGLGFVFAEASIDKAYANGGAVKKIETDAEKTLGLMEVRKSIFDMLTAKHDEKAAHHADHLKVFARQCVDCKHNKVNGGPCEVGIGNADPTCYEPGPHEHSQAGWDFAFVPPYAEKTF